MIIVPCYIRVSEAYRHWELALCITGGSLPSSSSYSLPPSLVICGLTTNDGGRLHKEEESSNHPVVRL